ncbi:competence protein ComEC [Gracilibacillus halotolerans]|uniref:Competence protein ComEC n=1 Tax=Gracilibacillus halotolerans TaxID=74386 RepID=A0A841RIZ3_9BACI|nr:competence protein ComEC [Gracilibacillus halotolerans]
MSGQWHWLVIVCSLAYVAKSTDFPLIFLPIILLIFLHKKFKPLFILFLVLLFCFFYLLIVPNKWELTWTEDIVTFRGNIVKPPKETNKTIQLVIQPENSPVRIEALHFKTEGTIPLQDIHPGMTCEFTGKLQEIQRATNPGQFDYKGYAQTDNIYGQIVLEPPYLHGCSGSNLFTNLYAIRHKMIERITLHSSEESNAWLLALLFGDRSAIPDDVTQLFQEWGLSHLLAISGLHVGLLAACFYFLCLYIFRLSYERTTMILICFFSLYPLLSGGAPSVWRSSLFYVIILIFSLSNKKWSFTDLLSVVFLLMIIVDPIIIEKIAFQFSFIVTFTILLSRNILKGLSIHWGSLVISLISMLAILPIQLYHFYQLQPLSVLVNFFVIPYFSIFVMPTLLVLVITMPFNPIHTFLDFLFIQVHERFLDVLFIVDELLLDPWVVGQFPLEYFLVYYCFFFLMMKAWDSGLLKKSFIYGLLLTLLVMIVSVTPFLKNEARITMLDIGQGDAIVVETSKREGVYLIDAGGTFSFLDNQPSNQVFKQVIDPYLKYRGITSIDGIFLTHEDTDHIGSVPFILDQYKVDTIYTHPYFDPDILRQFQAISPQTKFEFLITGESYGVKGFTFTVLHPGHDSKDRNENSLVLYANFGQIEGLLTGDIGVETEELIVNKLTPLQVDFIKVAHHGSNTSTGQYFLEKVNPNAAFISVGRNNRYGHPHDEVLERLEKNDIAVWRTDKHGAISIKINQGSGTITTYLPYDEVERVDEH